jgi:hypothetical protein
MHIVSFAKTLNINIRNLYSNLELISPVYFSDSICHVSPSQQTDTSNIMEASFWIDPKHDDFKGALLYKLQRKYANRADGQPNISVSPNEDPATNVYFLVIWNITDISYIFYACLIECTADFTWDEYKLWALYDEYEYKIFFVYHRFNISTWSMSEDAMMKIRLNATHGSDYKLDIIISEGIEEYNMRKPIRIDTKKLLLSSPMSDALVYDDSHFIKSSFELNIHNQCLNVDLVSPTYDIDCPLQCCRPPDYKVCAGDTMRSAFINERDVMYYGALIYRLQKKQTHEYTEIGGNTSNSIHLLVVWRFESEKLYANVLLVEHDKEFDWYKDDLGRLYNKNDDRFRWFHCSAIETWSLDDDTALVTLMNTFEITDKGLILNIAIFEAERNSSTRTPVHIDLKR